MYTTQALKKEHKRQMKLLRHELEASTRQVREGARRMDEDFKKIKKGMVYEPPKPKRASLPLRILSLLF